MIFSTRQFRGSAIACVAVVLSVLIPAIGSSAQALDSGSTTQTQVPTASPAIVGISPATAMAGSTAIALTVNGANLTGGDVVDWNGKGLSTTLVSSTELTAHVPSSDLLNSGSDTITVDTSTGIASNGLPFSVTAAMLLKSLGPNRCLAGSRGFTLTLFGLRFPTNSVATWDRKPLATKWVSSTELTTHIDSSFVTAPKTANVTVTSTSSATSIVLPFTVGADPILSNILPVSVLANSGTFTLTVNGGQFASGYNIAWNGAPLTTTFVNGNQLTAVVPAADIEAAGSVTIDVVTPNGLSSGPDQLVIQPDPAIDHVEPAHAPAGTQGVTVKIAGSNFNGNCSVLWNGAPISKVLVSQTELQSYAPAALLANPGTATLVVQFNGVNSNPKTVAIDPLPVLTSLAPDSVDQEGPNDTVTVSGKNFVAGCVVQWNGVNLATTFNSSTSVSAIIPASDTANAGIGQITVENPDSAVTAPLSFRVLVVSNSPLWNQRLVWAHDIMGYSYAYPESGPGLYEELYPLDMSSAPPGLSPATDIQLAQAEGIDAFAVEIVVDGTAADPVLSAADSVSPAFYVAPTIDLSTMVGQSPSAMENAVVKAVKAYAFDAATHPSAARDSGNLVIWTFDTSQMPNANWENVLNRTAAAGIRTTWVADIDGLFAGSVLFDLFGIGGDYFVDDFGCLRLAGAGVFEQSAVLTE